MRKFLLPLLLLASPAFADSRTDCPTPNPCKIITLTPDEEKVLTAPNAIFDTALVGRKIDLENFISYMRNKIEKAPAGDMPKAPEPDKK